MVPRPHPAVNIEASVQMFSIANVTLSDLNQVSCQFFASDYCVERVNFSSGVAFDLWRNRSVAKR
jgi:hypothetical protein